MITPKLRANERIIIWAVVLRFTVFAIPLIVFIAVVMLQWALKNCMIVLDFIAYFIDNSVIKKYAHRFPSVIATKS